MRNYKELILCVAVFAVFALLFCGSASIEEAKFAQCSSNQKQLITAALSYGNDNDGNWWHMGRGIFNYKEAKFPTTASINLIPYLTELPVEFIRGRAWCGDAGDFVPDVFFCPDQNYYFKKRYHRDLDGYPMVSGFGKLFNRPEVAVKGSSRKRSASELIFCADGLAKTTGNSNANRLLAGYTTSSFSSLLNLRHKEKANAAMLDGSVQVVTAADIAGGVDKAKILLGATGSIGAGAIKNYFINNDNTKLLP